jgi:hypothetical protein
MELNIPGNSASGYGNATPASPQSKPMNLQGGSTDLQQNAQYRKPYAVNNGNPGGANNMPRYRGNPMFGGFMPPRRTPAPLPMIGGPYQNNPASSSGRAYSRPPGEFEGEYESLDAARQAARQQREQGMNRPPMPQRFDNLTYQLMQDPLVNNQGMQRILGYFNNQRGVSPSGNRMYDPYNYYGGGSGYYQPSPQGYWNQGQNPALGRYRPPMMNYGGQSWMDQGGYNYNLPGAGGYFPTQGYWG